MELLITNFYRMKNICLGITLCFMLIGCDDFLDKKSDLSLSIPQSLRDVRAILDYQYSINDNYPGLTDLASDDYFVDYTTWKSRPVRDQGIYIWDGDLDTYHNQSWTQPYNMVMIANVALETIERLRGQESDILLGQLRGEALFVRAVSHFLVSQLFCAAFDPNGENRTDGIPIRTSSDLNVPSLRSTVGESYEKILSDLTEAVYLLPEQSESITRPSVVAAYALLSRVYLSMQDYANALSSAREVLRRKHDLLDYNGVDHTLAMPFEPRSNPEIIYFAQNVNSSTFISKTRANVDTTLFAQYKVGDRRIDVFYEKKSNGYWAFKGHYTGLASNLFNGLATDEVYLTAAECYARKGVVDSSLLLLNTLLAKRWEESKFEPYSNVGAADLLKIILEERRKQLVFRGVRWTDLKRLNFDERFRVTLYRKLFNGTSTEIYSLPPNDPRYIHAIPTEVIERTQIPQNPR